jgi:hypothetical protein
MSPVNQFTTPGPSERIVAYPRNLFLGQGNGNIIVRDFERSLKFYETLLGETSRTTPPVVSLPAAAR